MGVKTFDPLGQFVGTSQTDVNGGTLYSAPLGDTGRNYESFTQRPAGYNGKKADKVVAGDPKYGEVRDNSGNLLRFDKELGKWTKAGDDGDITTAMGATDMAAEKEAIERTREDQLAAIRAEANSIFDPKIAEARQVGREREGSAEGQLGVTRGLGLSTAGTSFLMAIQRANEQKINEIEAEKTAYLKEGNYNASQRAEAKLQQLREDNFKLWESNRNFAIQEAGLDIDRAKLGIQQGQLELSRQNAMIDQQQAISNLTGSITPLIAEMAGLDPGTPTYQAQQAAIQNALQEAGLTGYLNGEKTWDRLAQEVQLNLQQQGIEIDLKQLEESIRHNKVQEGLEGARVAIARANAAQEASIYGGEIQKRKIMRDMNTGENLGERIEFKNGEVRYVDPIGNIIDTNTIDLGKVDFSDSSPTFDLATMIMGQGALGNNLGFTSQYANNYLNGGFNTPLTGAEVITPDTSGTTPDQLSNVTVMVHPTTGELKDVQQSDVSSSIRRWIYN
jgi:hypothetical protein